MRVRDKLACISLAVLKELLSYEVKLSARYLQWDGK
jgi:hypothetical protein